MDLLLFFLMILAVLFFSFKGLLLILRWSAPLLFKKQLKRQEQERLERVERLRAMGINIKSANDEKDNK